MTDVQLVMDLAGCSQEDAERALAIHKDTVIAVDALLTKPPTQGDKYVPEKPKVNDGLTDEQRALCERGRWLQDKVNAVFSVAHSKIRSQPDPDSQELSSAASPAALLPGPAPAEE